MLTVRRVRPSGSRALRKHPPPRQVQRELPQIHFEILRQGNRSPLHAASRKHQVERRLEQRQLRCVPIHHQPAFDVIAETRGVGADPHIKLLVRSSRAIQDPAAVPPLAVFSFRGRAKTTPSTYLPAVAQSILRF